MGTRSSRGCIRLYNGDVVEVYNLLYGGISEVQIKD
ncbi:MAG: L,D-transpeptidase family protein [Planctomycetota bacterium]